MAKFVIVKMKVDGNLIVKPKSAEGKMRARSALVLSISDVHSTKGRYDKCVSAQFSGLGPRTQYVVGKTSRADYLDTDPGSKCGAGINFFRTRKEAVNYNG